MIRPRNLAIVATGVLLAATAIGLSAATAHEPRAHPQKIWVGSGGLYVRASLGSYCWSRREEGTGFWNGFCADAAYPIDVRGRLPVQPRDRVTLHVPDHARRVNVSLLRVEGSAINHGDWRARARRVGDGPHRWRFRLPADLQNANRLDVFVRYERGDADFWAGIDPTG
ncbi:MAG: hypothetical protein ACR2G3_00630 [Solirubrobacterales bacterium]